MRLSLDAYSLQMSAVASVEPLSEMTSSKSPYVLRQMALDGCREVSLAVVYRQSAHDFALAHQRSGGCS